MVFHIIPADILLITRVFTRPLRARKNITQLAKYPRVFYVKPSNKIYLFLRPVVRRNKMLTSELTQTSQ